MAWTYSNRVRLVRRGYFSNFEKWLPFIQKVLSQMFDLKVVHRYRFWRAIGGFTNYLVRTLSDEWIHSTKMNHTKMSNQNRKRGNLFTGKVGFIDFQILSLSIAYKSVQRWFINCMTKRPLCNRKFVIKFKFLKEGRWNSS